MISITFNDKGTAQSIGNIGQMIDNPEALLKVCGRRGANELKSWFQSRNSEGNKLGGRRTNFWNQIAQSVNAPVNEGRSRVRISITDYRFPQKVYGGTIKAKNAEALTIPVDPLARGRTAQVFEQETGIQLFLLRKKGGGFSNLLAGFIANKQLRIFYVLVKSVEQDPDPQALPPIEVFGAAIMETANEELARAFRTDGGGS